MPSFVGWLVSQHLLMSMTAQKKTSLTPKLSQNLPIKSECDLFELFVCAYRCRYECHQPTALEQLARNLDASTIYPNPPYPAGWYRCVDEPPRTWLPVTKQSARDLLAGDNGLADIESLWDGLGRVFLREVPKRYCLAFQSHHGAWWDTKTTHRERATWAADYFAWTSRVGTRCRASVYLHPWPIQFICGDHDRVWPNGFGRTWCARHHRLARFCPRFLRTAWPAWNAAHRYRAPNWARWASKTSSFISPTLPEVAQRRMPRQLKHFRIAHQSVF